MRDENELQPRLGRPGAAASPRGRRYLSRVLAAAMRQGTSTRGGIARFQGARLGRSAVAASLLSQGARSRRGIVKTRLVRLGGKGLGVMRAHLRYLQRDATSREGEAGRLYA